MHNDKLTKLLGVARNAAVMAGLFLVNDSAVNRKINQESKHAIKIEADRQSERILVDCLKKESDFPVLSEEMGYQANGLSEFKWILDPIDGSFNFERQIPVCCISIGLWQKEKPVLGVVYDFNRGELFSGIVGVGAWMNDVPIKVSPVAVKEKAVLFTGFPAASDFAYESLLPLLSQVQTFRKLRWIGSAALSLAYVACGRGDVYYERNIMLWDVAAGVALVLAAGGTSHYEKNKSGYHVFASNGRITSI